MIISGLRSKDANSILEIGCGTGMFTDFFIKQVLRSAA
jgi:16S rRNA A1518/A1519 N6-dimethyltransferase RsmA/KsgA/DIM1 with predicted DNA glycosylase/AP lyase activity